ncbi:MAG TPA: hypothetical protein VHS13_05050 [Edaphobacter sp.]|jgi:hypothetical protein|nr:hypothetical protein [Edaphobacter sp.]
MDEEQKNFLDDRLNSLAEHQPAILILRDQLLSLHGVHLVAPTEPDPDVDSLLVSGSVMEATVHFEEMAENSCHWNVAALWLQRREDLVAVATGYALSADGLWRQHSWGMKLNAIFETTEIRTCYFGLLMEGADADAFARRFFDE